MVTQTLNTLGYCRVSDRQNYSFEVQYEQIQRAAEHHKFGHAEIFADQDANSDLQFVERDGGKELLTRVLQLAQKGLTAVVIIPKIDNLGCGVVDVETAMRVLEKFGARMVFLDINVDTSTPIGRAFIQIAAVFAKLERTSKRESIQDALNKRRAAGILTGTEPYGWTAVNTGNVSPKGVKERRLVDNPEQQKWIRYMAQMAARGVSFTKIAADLNQKGVIAKNGGIWRFGSIAKVLGSRTVREWLEKK